MSIEFWRNDGKYICILFFQFSNWKSTYSTKNIRMSQNTFIFLLGNPSLAWCVALLNMIIQAWTVLARIPGQIPITGTQLIQLVQQIYGILYCSRTGVGTKIFRLVLFHGAGKQYPGIFLSQGHFNIGISLVISNGETSRTIKAEFDPTIDEAGNIPTDASKIAGGNRHGNGTEKRVTLDLADDYYQSRQYALAVPYIVQALDIEKQIVTNSIKGLNTTHKESFWDSWSSRVDRLTHFCIQLADNPEMAKSAYNSILMSKGILLKSTEEFNRIISNIHDPNLKNIITEYNELRALYTSVDPSVHELQDSL